MLLDCCLYGHNLHSLKANYKVHTAQQCEQKCNEICNIFLLNGVRFLVTEFLRFIIHVDRRSKKGIDKSVAF